MRFYHGEGFGPQHDHYQRLRRRFSSPMQGATIDRAADRLTVSGFSLADLSAARLADLYQHADLSRAEWLAVGDALRRLSHHATHEDDAALLRDLVTGKVVTL